MERHDIEIKSVELVRQIRDEQAELLVQMTSQEIIEFFREAGAAAKPKARPVDQAWQVASGDLPADILHPPQP